MGGLLISRSLLVNSQGLLLNFSILLLNSCPSTVEFPFFYCWLRGVTGEYSNFIVEFISECCWIFFFYCWLQGVTGEFRDSTVASWVRVPLR